MLLVLEVIQEGREAQIALSKRGAGWTSLLHLAEVQGWAKVVQHGDKTCSLALTEEGKKALSPKLRSDGKKHDSKQQLRSRGETTSEIRNHVRERYEASA